MPPMPPRTPPDQKHLLRPPCGLHDLLCRCHTGSVAPAGAPTQNSSCVSTFSQRAMGVTNCTPQQPDPSWAQFLLLSSPFGSGNSWVRRPLAPSCPSGARATNLNRPPVVACLIRESDADSGPLEAASYPIRERKANPNPPLEPPSASSRAIGLSQAAV